MVDVFNWTVLFSMWWSTLKPSLEPQVALTLISRVSRGLAGNANKKEQILGRRGFRCDLSPLALSVQSDQGWGRHGRRALACSWCWLHHYIWSQRAIKTAGSSLRRVCQRALAVTSLLPSSRYDSRGLTGEVIEQSGLTHEQRTEFSAGNFLLHIQKNRL